MSVSADRQTDARTQNNFIICPMLRYSYGADKNETSYIRQHGKVKGNS